MRLQRVPPFLKWVGGKRRYIPTLLRYVPESFNRYYEGFLGGGSMLLALNPASAVAIDKNERLIKTWQAVRIAPSAVAETLVEFGKDTSEEAYYIMRSRLNTNDFETPFDFAAGFIYLNRVGYRALYRERKDGGLNTPFGHYNNPGLPDIHHLLAISNRISEVRLIHGDSSLNLAPASFGDYVYLDPPYMDTFSSYVRYGFGRDEHEKLADTAKRLADRGVHVMISHKDHEVIRELYSGFYVSEYSASYAIGAGLEDDSEVTELVITSYAPNRTTLDQGLYGIQQPLAICP